MLTMLPLDAQMSGWSEPLMHGAEILHVETHDQDVAYNPAHVIECITDLRPVAVSFYHAEVVQVRAMCDHMAASGRRTRDTARKER